MRRLLAAALLVMAGCASEQRPEALVSPSPSPALAPSPTGRAERSPGATPRPATPSAAKPTPAGPAPTTAAPTAGASAEERFRDREAQSSARNALTCAKTIFTDSEDYRKATAEEMKKCEPSLDFLEDGPSPGAKTVSIKAVSENEYRVAVLSASGVCFGLRDNVQGPGTSYAKGPGAACRATGFPDASYGGSW